VGLRLTQVQTLLRLFERNVEGNYIENLFASKCSNTTIAPGMFSQILIRHSESKTVPRRFSLALVYLITNIRLSSFIWFFSLSTFAYGFSLILATEAEYYRYALTIFILW